MRDLRVCWPVLGHSRIYLLISRLRAHPGLGRISRSAAGHVALLKKIDKNKLRRFSLICRRSCSRMSLKIYAPLLFFLWACSLFSTTLFGVPIPLPTPQGRRAQQIKTRPECWIRGLHEASTQGIETTSANLFRKECLGMQRSPKAMLLRPTKIDLPECDCHLPTME